jgi:hypothetical protein
MRHSPAQLNKTAAVNKTAAGMVHPGIATVFDHSNISEANGIPGSQVGSQRRQI